MKYILTLALIIVLIIIYRKIKTSCNTVYVDRNGKKHKMELYTPQVGDDITFWIKTKASRGTSVDVQYNGKVVHATTLHKTPPLQGAFVVSSKSHQHPSNNPASMLYTIQPHQVMAIHNTIKTPIPAAVATTIEELINL